MKKVLSFVVALILAVNCSFSQDTVCPDYITDNPYYSNFQSDFNCWSIYGSRGWGLASSFGTSGVSPDGGPDDAVFSSPAIVLPTDSAGLRVRLMDSKWAGTGVYHLMIKAVGDSIFDTLATFTATSLNYHVQRSVSLAAYAGDTVNIALCVPFNSDPYFTNFEIFNTFGESATLEAPRYAAAVGDIVHFAVHITNMAESAIAYSWHSSLLDTTFTTSIPTLDVVYPGVGTENLSVVVSNASGDLVLHKTFSLFACDTVTTIPWIEEFVEDGCNATYNACWRIGSKWNHCPTGSSTSFQTEDGTSTPYINDYLFLDYEIIDSVELPLIRIPVSESDRLKLWLQFLGSVTVLVSTDGGNFYSDTVFRIESTNKMILRSVLLSQYAGQTISIRLLAIGNFYLDRVGVDYDTSLRVNIVVPSIANTNQPLPVSAYLRYGDTVGLSYVWYSAAGGSIFTNSLGDSAWITYSTAIPGDYDTVMVVATNTFNSDTAYAVVHVLDCTPVVAFPWHETFSNGLDCWYRPIGSNWHTEEETGYIDRWRLLSQCTDISTPQWIMSKAIVIPSDTNMEILLEWESLANNYFDYSYNCQVLITTAADFTDTSSYQLLYNMGFQPSLSVIPDVYSVSLSGYAGQTVHIAFKNNPSDNSMPTSIFIDNVVVRSITVPNCDVDTTLPFIEPFSSSTDFECWRKWNFGNSNNNQYIWRVSSKDGRTVMQSGGSSLAYYNAWLVTPSISLPQNGAGLHMDIDVCGSYRYENNHAYIPYLTIMITTTGAVDTNSFADTLLRRQYYSNWERIHLSLEEYAGQTVNIAFVHNNGSDYFDRDAGVYIDSLWIGYTYQPEINNISHNDAFVGDTTFFVAHTNGCVEDEILYTWHSSLLDTTIYSTEPNICLVYPATGAEVISLVLANSYGIALFSTSFNVSEHPLPEASIESPDIVIAGENISFVSILNSCSRNGLSYSWHSVLLNQSSSDSVWSVTYPYGGLDTVTLTVSNDYGTMTATKVLYVFDCDHPGLPYYETFEEVPGDDWLVGDVPPCWMSSAINSSSPIIPHVVGEHAFSQLYYFHDITDNALMLTAGDSGSSGYYFSNVVRATLPRFEMPLHALSMAFDYRYESVYNGSLVIGYYDENNDSFTPVDTVPPHSSTYTGRTISFASLPTNLDGRIALQWSCAGVYYSVVVDNIVVYDSFDHALLPVFTLDGPDTVMLTDTALFSVDLLQGDTAELVYCWHSTLRDTLFYTNESEVALSYNTTGRDTITVNVSNRYGKYEVMAVVDVCDNRIPDTVWRSVSVNAIMLDGTDVPDDLMVTGAGDYIDSSFVTLTAVYPDNIAFMYWITHEGDTVMDNPYIFRVLDDVVFDAVFNNLQGVVEVEDERFDVCPNPASSVINVTVSQPGKLSLFDQSGRKIASWLLTDGVTTIDVSNFHAGTYFLRFDTSKGFFVKKLIIFG